MQKNQMIIIMGMSGAGKSTALKILEDSDYVCVQNLPIQLIEKFVMVLPENGQESPQKVAFSIDIHSKRDCLAFESALTVLKERHTQFKILFLDATDEVLLKRYKESRRNHPLSGAARINTGIERERQLLSDFRRSSDFIIDTSQLLVREFREEIQKIFLKDADYRNLFITVLSFGFKNGIPRDADLVFDVRFLPNPYYDDTLKHMTGKEEAVRAFVMDNEVADTFLGKLSDMIEFLIPNYVKEGKNRLEIAIGCTGGKHRSVAIACALYKRLKAHEGYGVRIEHRDMELE